jgi:hypothetical protein
MNLFKDNLDEEMEDSVRDKEIKIIEKGQEMSRNGRAKGLD